MGGKRRFGRAHAPDMQIMHLCNARQGRKMPLDRFGIDAGRDRIERQIDGVSKQRPGAEDNRRTDD